MGTGYVRNDTANTIANGNVIDADTLDGEFNAVETAFQASTGHNHDGSAANGAPITKLGPTQDVVASATLLYPKTTNTVSLGTASLKFKDAHFDGIVYTDDITLNGTAITASAAELNIMDGITASTAELNIMDGVTATAAEINVLDGITASTTELNYVDGVTSAIQTQLDNKQPLDADLTAIGALAKADGNIIVGDGTTWVAESGATARASLGVTIGTDVQAWDANLDQIAALTPTDNNFIVGNGTAWTAETPASALESLGVTATATELNYVDGVTSAIQTQLNAKAPLNDPSFTGGIDVVGGFSVNSVAAYALKRRTYLTTSQTYTPSSDCKAIFVQLWGRGGNGGAVTTTTGDNGAGGGGQAGGYSEKFISSPEASYTVTIGATAGALSRFLGSATDIQCEGGANGGSGGNLLAAGGGTGGGSASGGDLNIPGQYGSAGNVAPNGGMMGSGGDSPLFGGGARGFGSSNINGPTARGFGAGGCGGLRVSAGTATGGSGSASICIVTEYF